MQGLWDTSNVKPRTDIIIAGDTLPAMFLNAVAARRDKVWMREKELGVWREWTWDETALAVREVAMGLAAIGFEPGDCASILSNTVVEWVVTDLGVLCAGGVANGIYPTDAAAQCEYLCTDSASVILFVEDDEQLDKVLEVRERLPLLRKIIVFDMEGLTKLDDPQVMVSKVSDSNTQSGRWVTTMRCGSGVVMIGFELQARSEGSSARPAARRALSPPGGQRTQRAWGPHQRQVFLFFHRRSPRTPSSFMPK